MKTTVHTLSLTRGAGKFLALISAVAGLAVSAAAADSPSDLLEQGIYSEETKGDLPGAVQLYQQAIASAKADESVAAQAQYHLGLCYYKQQDFTNATATFRKLVKEYPDQKDVVALAQKYLAGVDALQPVPWQDGEDLRLDIKLPSGMKLGFADYWMTAGPTNAAGQSTWHITSHVMAGPPSFSQVEVVADSFAPIHSRWKHPMLGDVDATYYSDHADLKWLNNGKTNTLSFSPPILDNEECVEMMRRLPMAAGYTATMQILPSLTGTIINITATVSGPEQVQVPAGTFSCYKVDLSIHQSFWYSADANRYLVKFEAGGVSAELTQIHQRFAGEPSVYDDTNDGFSLSAPAGWILDRKYVDTPTKTSLQLVSSDTSVVGQFDLQSIPSLNMGTNTAPREVVKAALKEPKMEHKNFAIREGTWADITVAGQPGVSVVSDYTDGDEKTTLYSVYTVGTTNAEGFSFIVAAKDFDQDKAAFDGIVASLNLK